MVMAKYKQATHITTAEEVRDFFRYIVFSLNLNFNPDDNFESYINYETGERIVNEEQAKLFNRLMDEAFEVCGDNIYEIGEELLRERLETK